MKLTPLDIHQKEFHRAIRGYSEEEVDKFLDDVAEDFERLFKENIELKEQFEKAKEDLNGYSGMEKSLQNALLTAQKSAEDVTVHAQKEADLIVRDAELKAKEIIQEAYDLKSKYETTLGSLKQAEEEFRTKFKSMLESYIRIADSTAVLADIGSNIVGINDKASSELEKIMSERIVSMPEIDNPVTESEISIGSDILDIQDISDTPEYQEVQGFPKIGMVKLDEEAPQKAGGRMEPAEDIELGGRSAGMEPEPVMPDSYIGETYVLDNFIEETYPGASDVVSSNNGGDLARKSIKDVKKDTFTGRPDTSDFDSLAF